MAPFPSVDKNQFGFPGIDVEHIQQVHNIGTFLDREFIGIFGQSIEECSKEFNLNMYLHGVLSSNKLSFRLIPVLRIIV